MHERQAQAYLRVRVTRGNEMSKMRPTNLPCDDGHCVGNYCTYDQECQDENWFTNPEYLKEEKNENCVI